MKPLKSRISVSKILLALGISSMPLLVYVLYLLVLHLTAQQSEVGSVLRYDKYELEFTHLTLLGVFSGLVLASVSIRFGWWKGCGISPTLLFAVLYLVMIYPGVVLIRNDSQRLVDGVLLYNAATVAYAFGVVLMGFWGERRLKRGRPSFLEPAGVVYQPTGHRGVSVIVLWCALTAVVGLGFYFMTGGGSRIVAFSTMGELLSEGVVSESASDVSAMRSKHYIAGTGIVDVLQNYLLRIVIPIGGLGLLGEGLRQKKKTLKVFGAGVLMMAWMMALGTGSRLLFAQLVLIFVIWLSWTGYLTVRRTIIFGVGVAVCLIVMTASLGRMKDQGGFYFNMIGSVNRLVERVTLTKGAVTRYAFDIYPDEFSFEQGRTIKKKLMGISGGDGMTLAEEMYFIHTKGKRGTAGPNSFAELYVNFGATGTLLGAFIIGLLVQAASYILRNHMRENAFIMAGFSFVTLAVAYWGYSDVSAPKTFGTHVLIVYMFGGSFFFWFIGRLFGPLRSSTGEAVMLPPSKPVSKTVPNIDA